MLTPVMPHFEYFFLSVDECLLLLGSGVSVSLVALVESSGDVDPSSATAGKLSIKRIRLSNDLIAASIE